MRLGISTATSVSGIPFFVLVCCFYKETELTSWGSTRHWRRLGKLPSPSRGKVIKWLPVLMAESYSVPHFCESFINVFLSWPELPLSYTADGSVWCAKCGAETQVLCPEPSPGVCFSSLSSLIFLVRCADLLKEPVQACCDCYFSLNCWPWATTSWSFKSFILVFLVHNHSPNAIYVNI